MGKKEQFQKILINSNTAIAIGTESHLDPSIKNSEFLPPGFTAFRRDRQDGWGGVIIIVKLSLIANEVLKSIDTELLAIQIETLKKPVIIVAAYRPPKSDSEYLERLSGEINVLFQKYKTSPFWIGGDLNLPDIDWDINLIVGHQYTKKLNETFLDMMVDCNLEQIIDSPTRQNNCLDILLTNNTTLVTSIVDIPGISDHTSIPVVDVMCHPLRSRPIS